MAGKGPSHGVPRFSECRFVNSAGDPPGFSLCFARTAKRAFQRASITALAVRTFRRRPVVCLTAGVPLTWIDKNCQSM